MTPAALADLLRQKAAGHPGRFLVALAGPPASGKTTLAANLAAILGPGARVVPMDGFHFDDAVLEARGHRARKGAPHTFDALGFAHCLRRIRKGEEVAIPVFDRNLELARAGADVVTGDDRIILVEGNYLLLNQTPWTALHPLFDFRIFVSATESLLTRRLTERWQHYGRTDAAEWIASNDLPNALTVLRGSTGWDLLIEASDIRLPV
jgi:pantothenate kinase